MAFNINDFSAQVNKHGLAQTNLFLVRIVPPPGFTGIADGNADEDNAVELNLARELEFFCRSVTLPELDAQTTDYQKQSFGAITRRPQSIQFPILPTVFMVDSNFAILKFFHRWMQKIVNYDTSSGPISEVDGMLPHEMGYKIDYATTIEIIVYSFQSESITYTYKMSGAYPIQVGNITEAWESQGEIMTLPVGFTYDELQVTGAKSGNVVGGLSGGNGLLSYLSSINTFTQAIRGLRRPRGIQDAINQVTNVSTILKSF
jgi:hypothetical protein